MSTDTSIRPTIPLPRSAWDCHAHVFGPFDVYPLLPHRRYDPPLGPADAYLRNLDSLGFEHGVLVHASAYGFDNSCTRDAVRTGNGRVVGVCVVEPTISDRQLQRLHDDGFRAVRVTVTGARVQQYTGALDFDGLDRLAPRLKALGWHAQVWANCHCIVDAAARLTAYGIPIVFDHMGYFDPGAGVGDDIFRSFVSLLADNDFWVKMTPIRLTKTDPTLASIRPFHDCILRVIPDRAIFGSDWPYISLPDLPSRTRWLVDLFDAWTPDNSLRQQVFVDNPARLYGRASA